MYLQCCAILLWSVLMSEVFCTKSVVTDWGEHFPKEKFDMLVCKEPWPRLSSQVDSQRQQCLEGNLRQWSLQRAEGVRNKETVLSSSLNGRSNTAPSLGVRLILTCYGSLVQESMRKNWKQVGSVILDLPDHVKWFSWSVLLFSWVLST